MTLTWLVFVIAALACYRGTVLITRCLGPWGIFKKLRKIDKCSKLLSCPRCVSIYLGAFTALGLYLSGIRFGLSDNFGLLIWVMLALAFSGLTIMLDRIFTADYAPK